MSCLSVHNIAKSFGAVQALNPLSLDFEAGKVTAIVGDNGAGKSVFLKLLAGLLHPDEGRIVVNGQNVTRLHAAQRRLKGIEMVYQDLALAQQQDVITNLFMGREITRGVFGWLRRKAMKATAKTSLAQIGINLPDLRVPVRFLSGGQQQAVAIARALLFGPNVLLLDEPTAALGANEVQNVLNIIQRQKAAGRVVILVSHRLNDVFAVSDRILVMKQGHMVADYATRFASLEKVVADIVG